jgi:sialate O-acetylesterase
VYGEKLPFSGPVVAKVTPQGKKIRVQFDHAKGLRTTDGKAPVGFDISEDGETYHPAEAAIKGTSVELSSPQVQKPRYARYGWYTYLEPNLVNADGLPTQPYAPAP